MVDFKKAGQQDWNNSPRFRVQSLETQTISGAREQDCNSVSLSKAFTSISLMLQYRSRECWPIRTMRQSGNLILGSIGFA